MKFEVIKVQKRLENFLSESNNEIKISKRINEGIKNLDNEEQNSIKLLSYISKINKKQKELEKLNSQSMKNIKFNYDKENNDIKYEEYYFNGIEEKEMNCQKEKQIENNKESIKDDILTSFEKKIVNIELLLEKK